MKKLMIIGMVMMLGFSGCNLLEKPDPNKIVFTDPEYGYQVTYPKAWLFASPNKPGAPESFNETLDTFFVSTPPQSIQLYVAKNKAELNEEEYINAYVKELIEKSYPEEAFGENPIEIESISDYNGANTKGKEVKLNQYTTDKKLSQRIVIVFIPTDQHYFIFKTSIASALEKNAADPYESTRATNLNILLSDFVLPSN